MQNAFNPLEILKVLVEHRVEFIVIGGFASWMHGAPIVTTDIDIIYSPKPANVNYLAAALRKLDAHYRHQHGRIISANPELLANTQGAGHHLFSTREGDLDALRTVSDLGFDDLSSDTVVIEIDGCNIHFATLAKIIELKTEANRPKDIAALPTLKATLRTKDK